MYSYSEPHRWMRLAYCAITQPAPKMPTPAMTIAMGVAAPAPRPVAERPTISGSRVATENTGPMKPIDCARTPVIVTRLRPRAALGVELISAPGKVGGGYQRLCTDSEQRVRLVERW